MTDHEWDQWPDEQPELPAGDEAGSDGFGASDFTAELPDHEPPDAGTDVDGFGEAPEPDGAPDRSTPIGYGDALADEPAEPADDAGQPEGTAGFGAADDAPVGADPDVDPHGEDPSWPQTTFPDPLDLGPPPEPVDGYPWTDPAVLGGAATPLPDPAAEAATGTPDMAELFAYAGEDPSPGGWTNLTASEDPATSTLARFWSAS